jgi:creatinine amidohydrolase
MLAIDPGVVRIERAKAGCTDPLEALMPRLRAEGVRPISSNGVLGDPQGASAAEGELLLAAMTDDLVATLGVRWPHAGQRA